MPKICNSCGTANRDSAVTCKKCGTMLSGSNNANTINSVNVPTSTNTTNTIKPARTVSPSNQAGATRTVIPVNNSGISNVQPTNNSNTYMAGNTKINSFTINKMKYVYLGLAVFLCVCFVIGWYVNTRGKKFVGTWETTVNGYKSRMTLNKDGSGALVDLGESKEIKWETDGDEFILEVKEGTGSIKAIFKYTLEKDKLTLTSGDDVFVFVKKE